MDPHTSIKQWPLDERPRERLLRGGPGILSDAELIAVLLRSGRGGQTAVDLARLLIVAEGGLRGLASRNPSELMRTPGVGEAKALALLAAFELGRRVQLQAWDQRPILRSPEDVARILAPRLRDRRQEVFTLLVLDAQNGVKHQADLSTGTLNASLVHPREVYKCAIDHEAAAIIVAHNHPSGNPEPSREDIQMTHQLSEAGRIVGIPLHDHVIVAGKEYVSMAERGMV